MRLSAEYLIQYGASGGAYVPAVTSEDVVDVYKVRGTLEGLAAHFACKRQTTQKELRPLIHHVELAELSLEEGDLAEVERHNSAFHNSLVGLANNQFLSRQLYLVQPFTYFLRQQVIEVAKANPLAHKLYDKHLQVNMAGHREIVQILAAGDEDKAQQYLIEHIDEASTSMVAVLGF